MAIKYKLIASIIGASGVSAGITTPLVVSSTHKTQVSKSVPSVHVGASEADLVTGREKIEKVLDNNQLIDLPNVVSEEVKSVLEDTLNNEEDNYLGDTKIHDEVERNDWREALILIREVRKDRNSYQNKRLSKNQRKALKERYDYFSTADSDSLINSYNVRSDLYKLNWEGEKLTLVKNPEERENWGWGKWEDNPVRHFYVEGRESSWKGKIKGYELNKEKENVRIEAEIEFDIADWLLTEMERIYRKIRHTL